MQMAITNTRSRLPLLFLILVATGVWQCDFVTAVFTSGDQALYINEFQAVNIHGQLDPDYRNLADWIEIYNGAGTAVDLGGYYLGDSFIGGRKWKIPANTHIDPGGFIVFWADARNSGRHTNFKLRSSGGHICLFSREGAIIDCIRYRRQQADISIGRSPDGGFEWRYFPCPTPGRPNGNAGLANNFRAGAVAFSHPGGIYPGPIQLRLKAKGEIHYTRDGSVPVSESPVYRQPITIAKTTVIRARVLATPVLPGAITTHTYFIGERFSLPVVAITTAPSNLWDQTSGIYIVGANPARPNYRQDWERAANAEFYADDGQCCFNQMLGLKTGGDSSRTGPQKSLTLYARNKYGQATIAYHAFPLETSQEYPTLYLRQGAEFQNGLAYHLLQQQMDLDIIAYRSVVVFINGRYWGLYNLLEKDNEEYLARHHHIDPWQIDLLNIQNNHLILKRGDTNAYRKLLGFVRLADMKDQRNYRYLTTQIDIHEYLNYIIFNHFIGNRDWFNNIACWRPRRPSGRWRWIASDLNSTFISHKIGTTVYDYQLNHLQRNRQLKIGFLELLDNREFRHEFIQRFAGYLNTSFHPRRVQRIFTRLNRAVAPEVARHFARWPSEGYYGLSDPKNPVARSDYWAKKYVANVLEYARRRPEYVRRHLIQQFGLSGTFRLELRIVNPEGGMVIINGVVVSASNNADPYLYFTDIPLRLVIIPRPGYYVAAPGTPSPDNIVRLSPTYAQDTTLEIKFQAGIYR